MNFKTDYVPITYNIILYYIILTSDDRLCSFFLTITCVGANSSDEFKGVPP